MGLNKKAQINSMYFAVIVGIMIFMVGMVFLNFITPEVTRASTAMDCENSTITDGSKATCLVIDSVMPYIILLIISISGGYITEKFLV